MRRDDIQRTLDLFVAETGAPSIPLELEQPRRGYRYSEDSVLVAAFATDVGGLAPSAVVDLGAGCGVIGLLLGSRWPQSELRFVELQRPLAEICLRNVRRNGMAQRAQVLNVDLRCAAWGLGVGSDAMVICNPPYYEIGSGRLSPRSELAMAHHQLTCNLEQLLSSCALQMAVGSRLVLIYPLLRERILLATLVKHGFSVDGVCPVKRMGAEASRVMISATFQSSESC